MYFWSWCFSFSKMRNAGHTAAHSCTQLPDWLTSWHFSTRSSGERHLRSCARTSSCSQTVSEMFPVGVLGMNDTATDYAPETKIYKLTTTPELWNRSRQSNRSYRSNTRKKKSRLYLSFLSVFRWFHSTALHAEAPMSTKRATHVLPRTSRVATCH